MGNKFYKFCIDFSVHYNTKEEVEEKKVDISGDNPVEETI